MSDTRYQWIYQGTTLIKDYNDHSEHMSHHYLLDIKEDSRNNQVVPQVVYYIRFVGENTSIPESVQNFAQKCTIAADRSGAGTLEYAEVLKNFPGFMYYPFVRYNGIVLHYDVNDSMDDIKRRTTEFNKNAPEYYKSICECLDGKSILDQ